MVVLGFSALDASSVLGANHGSLVCTTGSLQTLVQNRPGHQPVIIQKICGEFGFISCQKPFAHSIC